jgi:large subunit ribosomal protein L14
MYRGSKCTIIDNSGARIGRVIRTNVNTNPIRVGSIILVSILKRDFTRKRIRLGQVFRAIVLSRGFLTSREFGHLVSGNNIIMLLKRTDVVPVSKRIKGPVPPELRKLKFSKLMSMGMYVF